MCWQIITRQGDRGRRAAAVQERTAPLGAAGAVTGGPSAESRGCSNVGDGDLQKEKARQGKQGMRE